MKKLYNWFMSLFKSKARPYVKPYVDPKKDTYVYQNKKIDKFDKLR